MSTLKKIANKKSATCFTACLITLIMALTLCLPGCYSSTKRSSNSSNTSNQSSSANAKSRDFYEGTWLCASYKKDGQTVSYSGLAVDKKRNFKHYLALQLDDVAYLDGTTPDGEENNGDNANYRLLPPRDGNSVIIIYFEKLTGK